jgi:integration host factor subunit beta
MVRSELLQKFCNQNPQLLNRDAKKILEIIFDQIIEALSRGNNVEIRGFGRYKIVKRKARVGRNPKNSQIVQIPEKNAIKWKMSKTFFKQLNKSFTDNKISDTY